MSELKYNELRKGNLLYFPFISGNVEVIGVNALYGVNEPYFNKLSVTEGINMYYEPIEVFKPIPLTEECLIKFGFFQYEINNIKFSEYIKSEKDNYRISTIAGNTNNCQLAINGYNTQTIIDSVHQLQNLYFALTGKELFYHD